MVTNIIPRPRATLRNRLVILLPPICFLLKDIVASVAFLPLEVNSERTDLYYFVAFLPGTIYVFGAWAIIFNLLVGIATGLILPRLLTHTKRHIAFSIVRGVTGGVLGGGIWLLMLTIASGGIAAWQWFVVGIFLSVIPFAVVGGVVALGVLIIESWIVRTVGVLPRALLGTVIAALIRIYSPLTSCKPYYESCTVSGVARDLLFYGVTVGAAAAILVGFRTEKPIS